MSVAASPASAPQPQTPQLTRREFLYYIWGASIALATAETVGAIVWFLIPRFKAGQFGGVFTIKISDLPKADSGPKEYPDGRFWLVNVGDATINDRRQPKGYPEREHTGVIALYKVCVHLGCLYKWVPTNNRFECPCHGSKYLSNGVRIDGPARRNLDVLVVQIVDNAGKVLAEIGKAGRTPAQGTPLEVPPTAAAILVNTGARILGDINDKPGGGK